MERHLALQRGLAGQLLLEKAALQAMVGKPYCVQLISTDKDEVHLYFIMHLVFGGPLHRRIRDHGGMPWVTARGVVTELVVALDALHCAQFVHADLKADNVLVERSGHVCLCDLGSCKRLHAPVRIVAIGAGAARHHLPPEWLVPAGSLAAPAADWWCVLTVQLGMISTLTLCAFRGQGAGSAAARNADRCGVASCTASESAHGIQ